MVAVFSYTKTKLFRSNTPLLHYSARVRRTILISTTFESMGAMGGVRRCATHSQESRIWMGAGLLLQTDFLPECPAEACRATV
jgi:hypothetical protein